MLVNWGVIAFQADGTKGRAPGVIKFDKQEDDSSG